MDITQAFPSKYVSAGDLQGRDVTVAIDRCAMEHVQGEDGTTDDLPVLYFQGMTKGMVLNKTNANTIASLYGKETDRWPGCQITLYPTETQFGGRMVSCVRVRSHQPASAGTQQQQNANETAALPQQPAPPSSPFF